jgi:hypothetical protein
VSLYYDRDDRSHDPDVDSRRWGRFQRGWNAFVEGKHVDSAVLAERLTYENLGYRMAATHNAAFNSKENESLVRRAYDLSVAIQAANLQVRGGASPGNRPEPK